MAPTFADTSSEVLARVSKVKAPVWQSKFDVINEEGVFRLLHYHALTEEKYKTPILIVYAWINRPYVLDLEAEVSVVQQYLKAGFDVYMIDWGYPTIADQYLDLDDYVDYLDKSIYNIARRKGVKKVTLHGYCLGGTLSAVYTALNQERVENLVLQAAPINFHTDNPIAAWARALDPDKIVDAYHSAPGAFLNAGFLLLDPVRLILGKYAGFLDMIESDKGMSNFLRMEGWIFDSPDIPGQTYRQYIKEWYHNNSLIKGEFEIHGEKVDLGKITVPLLLLVATYDHIAPPESQKAILDIVSSEDKDAYEIAKGHIGITTSKASHKEFWPKVVDWIGSRSETA